MPTLVQEKHVLLGHGSEVRVDVWDNGNVEIWIGKEMIDPFRLAEIVAFVEQHGQVTVKAND